jgi:hypothetical protein
MDIGEKKECSSIYRDPVASISAPPAAMPTVQESFNDILPESIFAGLLVAVR